mgnify:CR=1 FL=1
MGWLLFVLGGKNESEAAMVLSTLTNQKAGVAIRLFVQGDERGHKVKLLGGGGAKFYIFA